MAWFLFLLIEPMHGDIDGLKRFTHFQASANNSDGLTTSYQPPPLSYHPQTNSFFYDPHNSFENFHQQDHLHNNSNFPPPRTYQVLQTTHLPLPSSLSAIMPALPTLQQSHHIPHSSPSATYTHTTSQSTHSSLFSSSSAIPTNSIPQPSHMQEQDYENSDSEDVFSIKDDIDTDKVSSVHNQLPGA